MVNNGTIKVYIIESIKQHNICWWNKMQRQTAAFANSRRLTSGGVRRAPAAKALDKYKHYLSITQINKYT